MASDLDRYALPLSPHASRRLLLAVGLAVVLAFALPSWLGAAGRTILAWDAAALLLLALSWAHILKSTPEETRARAALNDPGRTSLRALVIFCSAFSMVVANVFAKNAKTLAPQAPSILIWASLTAVALSWLLTHTSYALRYAHLYYRDADVDTDDDEGPPGGLDFPHGVAPCELDFAYFSFTVGMTFQVSDVIVTTTPMRHAVLAQAVLAFAYNTAVLAFCLQLIFGAL